MAGFDDEKLLKLLSHPSGPIRARAIPTLGIRIGKSIHLKEALFTAAADPDNLALKFYAFIKVAWVAAITILDNGRNDDFLRLKKVVTQWPENEQSGFNSCIKGYRNFDKLV